MRISDWSSDVCSSDLFDFDPPCRRHFKALLLTINLRRECPKLGLGQARRLFRSEAAELSNIAVPECLHPRQVAIGHVGSHVAKALPLFRACFSALHCDVDEIALGFKIMGRKASCRAKDCARAQCVKTHHQPASKLDLAARQRGEDLLELIGMKCVDIVEDRDGLQEEWRAHPVDLDLLYAPKKIGRAHV